MNKIKTLVLVVLFSIVIFILFIYNPLKASIDVCEDYRYFCQVGSEDPSIYEVACGNQTLYANCLNGKVCAAEIEAEFGLFELFTNDTKTEEELRKIMCNGDMN